MAKPLDQQVIVITGASSGIGRETAKPLAKRGASVVVSARRDEALDDLVDLIKAEGGEATSIPVDVSDYTAVEALATGARDTYGRIDTWVNNAAVLLVGEFEHLDLDESRRLFDVNFWGEYHGMKAALSVMRDQGYGTIINITSVTARRPLPLQSVYSASKAALNGLTEAVRAELQGSGIELCLVMPATIDTPLYQHSRSKEGYTPRAFAPIYPPSEVANAIAKVAEHPRRSIYAGPAGKFMSVSNQLMPDVMDKVLGKVGRPALLSDMHEPPRGQDNLDTPMTDMPATTTGGWRDARYKTADKAARIALGIGALLVARRLIRR